MIYCQYDIVAIWTNIATKEQKTKILVALMVLVVIKLPGNLLNHFKDKVLMTRNPCIPHMTPLDCDKPKKKRGTEIKYRKGFKSES